MDNPETLRLLTAINLNLTEQTDTMRRNEARTQRIAELVKTLVKQKQLERDIGNAIVKALINE